MEKTKGPTEYAASVYLAWRATIDKLPQGRASFLTRYGRYSIYLRVSEVATPNYFLNRLE